MTEMEAIRQRHSVRSYQDRRIEAEKIEQLRQCIDRCNEEGQLHLQFLEEAEGTFRRLMSRFMGLSSAPSVIACVGPESADLDERIGYYGQKVVLLAQQLGLNTCWAGTFQKKKVPADIAEGEKLVIVIAIGYGVDGGKERKSKTLDQVIRGGVENKPDWFIRGAEAALMAPTAINQQRFELVLNEDGTTEVIDKGGMLSRIDKGIVACHFEIGSRH